MESDGMLWNVGLGERITSCITCIAWELLVIKYLSGLGVSKYMSFHFLGIKLQQIHSRFWRMTFHAMHFSKMLPSTVPQLSVKHPSNPNLLFQNAWTQKTQNYRLLKRNMPVSQWFPPVFRFGAPLLHRGLQFQLLVCFAPGTKSSKTYLPRFYRGDLQREKRKTI